MICVGICNIAAKFRVIASSDIFGSMYNGSWHHHDDSAEAPPNRIRIREGYGMAQIIERGNDGFYHPKSEDDLIALIQHARNNKLKVRVRGSGHSSANASIYTGDFESPSQSNPNIDIYMDQMCGVTFDEANMLATVEAGCHIGHDLEDIAGVSTAHNSFMSRLQAKGWALPITGGIARQTIGGFLAMGSSGGSLTYSLLDALQHIRVVDGTGTVQEFNRDDNNLDDPFWAVGVSMGLLGIVTSVTFKCIETYNIKGQETTSRDDKCPVDCFGDGSSGRPSAAQFFKDTPYGRMMWWPQRGIEKIIVWEAERIPAEANFKPKPYQEFAPILGSTKPAQIAASLLFRLYGFINPPGPQGILQNIAAAVLKPLFPLIVNSFLASGMKGPQKFQDYWCDGVPMDDRIDYTLIPVKFSELWIPVDRTKEVFNKIRDHFRTHDITQVGTFTVEVYATPANNFWLSPAYQRDVIKYDMFWFAKNPGDPERDFYPQFWQLLDEFDYRPHWGKFLPGDVARLSSSYPRWDDFMALRDTMDPDQIFVTDYWRRHLGIEA